MREGERKGDILSFLAPCYTVAGFTGTTLCMRGEWSKLVFMFNHIVEMYLKVGDTMDPKGIEMEYNKEKRTEWSPLLVGWLKVNTDATFKNGIVTLGMVV